MVICAIVLGVLGECEVSVIALQRSPAVCSPGALPAAGWAEPRPHR